MSLRLSLAMVLAALAVSGRAATPPDNAGAAGAEKGAALARRILQETGVKGGLVAVIGCDDAALVAELRAGDAWVVHALDIDPAKVAAARAEIAGRGVYGPVSVERRADPARLPYADNLVNLVVAGDPAIAPMPEILRVLAPGGVAWVGGRRTVKPRPADIDEWTHFLHDAGNNAVAADERVGPPRAMQWMAPPLWLRSHETPSGFEAMVAGGGRVVYLLDEGLVGITDQRLPERWSLVCRDAFNGTLLWKRPVGPWGWPEWAADRFEGKDWTTITGGRTVVPDENHRRVVVQGDRLYVTLGYRAPLTILDAATGTTLATVEGTEPVRQIVAADGVVLAYSKTGDDAPARRKGKAQAEDGGGVLTAVDGAKGAVLWRKELGTLRGLSLAIGGGRVIYDAGPGLAAADLRTGRELWKASGPARGAQTLVVKDGVIVLRAGKGVEALDAATGGRLWRKETEFGEAVFGTDLFVVDGTVWPGMFHVEKDRSPGGRRSAHVLAVGFDLRTGEERKRIFAPDLLSPEHHHRCYRNKATDRYLIASMEGAEFLDLRGAAHVQNNFVRGSCRMGMVPCNGFLYVPPDQCFCQPGAKQLGFTALAPAEAAAAVTPVPDAQRIEKGPAYGEGAGGPSGDDPADWPTYRRDAARHGATATPVGTDVSERWRAKIGGRLTQPVCAGGRVYAAAVDAHTLHAFDAATGAPAWTFVAGGRIDSPPTVSGGRVLLGSADGRVYCLRATDGALAWSFLAAPADRRIGCFNQVESAWPVHGSVLVHDGVAYATAGRSTYLDGGIRVWGLDPATGRIVHRTTLSGPFPDGTNLVRDVAFYVRGANSDVLVAEGGFLYMRHKRLTASLEEKDYPDLSSKGEADVGLHVFSTAGLLDGSWYNRAFWMYAKRWPGFQLANQAPKSGQILAVGETATYAVQPFVRRNVHSPMFFPGKDGYLLYADRNGNEPQIVGEEGSRPPVEWLPQSEYERGGGRSPEKLGNPAFGLDKMTGYTRAEPPLWKAWIPVRIRAMVKAGDALFAAGPPDEFDEKDPYAAFEGRKGAKLVTFAANDGKQLAELALDAAPVFDGLIAARGALYLAAEDGTLRCLGPAR